jgi:hypothetical protein
MRTTLLAAFVSILFFSNSLAAQTRPPTVPLAPLLTSTEFKSVSMIPKLYIGCDETRVEFPARSEKQFSVDPAQLVETAGPIEMGSASTGVRETMAEASRTDYLVVAGVRMDIVVPPYKGVPRRLAVHLHADDGSRNQDKPSLNAFAVRNNVILVYAAAPADESWRCICSGPPLVAALEEVRKRYDVYLEGNLFAGISGGSTFLTVQFLSHYAHRFPGVYALFAGGSLPPHWKRDFSETLMFYSRSAELMKKIHIYYVYGDLDFMYTEDELIKPGSEKTLIPSSRRAFLERGFSVSDTRVPGATHIWGFSQPLMIEKVWARELGAAAWAD